MAKFIIMLLLIAKLFQLCGVTGRIMLSTESERMRVTVLVNCNNNMFTQTFELF